MPDGFAGCIVCENCDPFLKPYVTESYKTRLIELITEAVALADEILQTNIAEEVELLSRLHQLQGYAEALIEPSNKTSGWEMPNPRDANKDPDIPMPNEYRKGGKINKAQYQQNIAGRDALAGLGECSEEETRYYDTLPPAS